MTKPSGENPDQERETQPRDDENDRHRERKHVVEDVKNTGEDDANEQGNGKRGDEEQVAVLHLINVTQQTAQRIAAVQGLSHRGSQAHETIKQPDAKPGKDTQRDIVCRQTFRVPCQPSGDTEQPHQVHGYQQEDEQMRGGSGGYEIPGGSQQLHVARYHRHA